MRKWLAFTLWILSGLAAFSFAEPLVINTRNATPTTIIFGKVITEAFRKKGMKIVMQASPAGRSLINVNTGLDDGDGPRVKGLEKSYPNLVRVDEQILTIEVVAFTRDFSFPTPHWDSLASYNVGIIRGLKVLETNIQQYDSLTKVKGLQSLFTLLKNNRIDVAVAAHLNGLAVAQKLAIHDIRVMEPPFVVRPLFLYLHKKHQKWVPQIEETLRQMKQDGTYSKLVKK